MQWIRPQGHILPVIKLGCQDEKMSLNSLIDLAIHLDHLTRNRQVPKEMLNSQPESSCSATIQLAQGTEREKNRMEKFCSYYGNPNHFLAQFPSRAKPLAKHNHTERIKTFTCSSKVSPSYFWSHQFITLNVQIKHCFSVLSALIDSRSAGNFMDQAIGEKLNIPTQSLQHPLKIPAIDDGHIGNRTVTLCNKPLLLKVRTLTQEYISFLTTVNTKHPIILGSPWMHLHDPQIYWFNKEITRWSRHTQDLPPIQCKMLVAWHVDWHIPIHLFKHHICPSHSTMLSTSFSTHDLTHSPATLASPCHQSHGYKNIVIMVIIDRFSKWFAYFIQNSRVHLCKHVLLLLNPGRHYKWRCSHPGLVQFYEETGCLCKFNIWLPPTS